MVSPPPRIVSMFNASRPKSTPISRDSTIIERTTSPVLPPPPEKTPQNMPSRILSAPGTYPISSLSPTLLSRHVPPPTRVASQPLPFSSQYANVTGTSGESSKGGVWDEIISLQGPIQNSSLPLQFQLYSPSAPVTPLLTSVAPLTMSPTGIPSLSQRQLPHLSFLLVSMNMTGSSPSDQPS